MDGINVDRQPNKNLYSSLDNLVFGRGPPPVHNHSPHNECSCVVECVCPAPVGCTCVVPVTDAVAMAHIYDIYNKLSMIEMQIQRLLYLEAQRKSRAII